MQVFQNNAFQAPAFQQGDSGFAAYDFDGLNYNDGVNYFLLYGSDPGERVKTWSEHRGLGGDVVQTNVSEANSVEMRIPLRVQGTSDASLAGAVAALNAKIDLCTDETPQTLVYDHVPYRVVASPRVDYPRDEVATAAMAAFVTLCLSRLP